MDPIFCLWRAVLPRRFWGDLVRQQAHHTARGADPVLRREHHFDALVLLVSEDLVGTRRFVEWEAVRDDAGWTNLATLHALQQRLHIPLDVGLPGLQGDGAVHERAEWYLIKESTLHPCHRDRPAVAAHHDRLTERYRAARLQPQHLFLRAQAAVHFRSP